EMMHLLEFAARKSHGAVHTSTRIPQGLLLAFGLVLLIVCCSCALIQYSVNRALKVLVPHLTHRSTLSARPAYRAILLLALLPLDSAYQISVTSGSRPSEVSWTLNCSDAFSISGGAPVSVEVTNVTGGANCLLRMFDSHRDGWNGAIWGALNQSFTLASGYTGEQVVQISFSPPPWPRVPTPSNAAPPSNPPAHALPPSPPPSPAGPFESSGWKRDSRGRLVYPPIPEIPLQVFGPRRGCTAASCTGVDSIVFPKPAPVKRAAPSSLLPPNCNTSAPGCVLVPTASLDPQPFGLTPKEPSFIAASGGPVGGSAGTYTAVWGDADGDGDLDLFVAGNARELGVGACEACPLGKRNDLQLGGCLDCEAGEEGPFGGSVRCFPCSPGQYNAQQGAESCTACLPACPVGGYCPQEGARSVQQTFELCPHGTFNSQPGAKSLEACEACPLGKANPVPGSSSCRACEPGFYCTEGAPAPLPCPGGTYSGATNLTSAAECTRAEPGYFAPTGSVEQTACTSGTYSDKVQQAACSPCEAGSYQEGEGSTGCNACTAGSYCPDGASAALPCEGGTYSNVTHLSDKSQCMLCPPGSSCATGVRSPTPCAPGSVQPEPGQTECKPCESGFFRAGSNGTSCQPCEAGNYCTQGASAPLPCAEGTYSNATNLSSLQECTETDPGYFAPTGSVAPTPCAMGTFARTNGTARCEVCEPGTYQNDTAATGCRPCPDGAYCTEGASAPLPCPGGTAQTPNATMTSANDCNDCGEGTFCPVGSVTETLCAPGTYNDKSKQQVCQRCEAGTFQDEEGATTCKACERGSFCKRGAAAPLPCESGTFSGATDLSEKSQCSLCPPGSSCSTGSTAPTPCAPGTVQPKPRSAKCELCPGGSFRAESNETSCEPCARGSYCPHGASAPLSCPEGSFSNAINLTAADQCTETQPGYFAPTGSDDQTPCVPGTFAPNSGMGRCEACAPGKYQNDTAATGCRPCPDGSYCTEGASAPLSCPGGTAQTPNATMTSANDCTDCGEGTFCPVGSVTETLCAPGTYNDKQKQQVCQRCEAGTFQDEEGTTTCKACAQGSFCPRGASVPLPCPEGRFSSAINLTEGQECTETDPGYFAPTGSVKPIPCAPGTFAPTKRTARCEACEPGTYQNDTAATGCRTCPDGSYCMEGSSAPLPCPGGTTQTPGVTMTRADDCTVCSEGTFCPVGSASPTKCSAGTFSDKLRQEVCTPCAAGTYQDEEGATACMACEQGSFCPHGASAALRCEAGTYSDATDLASAEECTETSPGYFAPTGSIVPTPCAPGSFSNTPKAVVCTPCEPGTFQPSSSAKECNECPRGSYCLKGASNPIGCESGAGIAFAVTQERRSRSSEGCVCESGYYNSSAVNRSCAVCPSGTDCDVPGFTLETLPVRRGYFRLSGKSIDVRRCPDALANCTDSSECPETTSGCAGTLRLNSSTRGCHDGLEGTYCLLCTRHEGKRVYYSAASSRERAQCKECPDAVQNTILIVFSSVLGVAVVGGTLYIVHRQLSLPIRQWLRQAWRSFSPYVKLKILVGFYVIAGAVERVYEVDLPPEARQLLNAFSVVVSFGFDAVDGLLECLDFRGYMARLATYMLTPVLIASVILLLSAVYFRADVKADVRVSGKRSLTMLLERASPFLLQLVFFAYPQVTRVAFNGFSCYDFTESSWLKTDVGIQCYTSQHRVAQALAIVAISMYPVGLLVLTGALLYTARQPILKERPTPFSQAVAFLHRDYKMEFYWWELVEMLRRFVLVGLLVLYQDTMMQLIIATLLCAVFLLLQVQASPYRRKEDELLASISSFCLVVVFMCATSFKYLSFTNLNDIQDKMSIEQRRVYVLGGDTILVFLISSLLVTLACSVGIFIMQLLAERVQLLAEDELAILRKEAMLSTNRRSSSSQVSVLRWGHQIARLRRVVVAGVTPTSTMSSGGRFTATGKFLISEKPEEAAFGLAHFMGVLDPFGLAAGGLEKVCAEVKRFVETVRKLDNNSPEMASLREFARIDSSYEDVSKQIGADTEEWLEYILKQPASERKYHNGIRDAGRGLVHFADFVSHPVAQQAELDPVHVLALRFYTTHAFKYMNGPLRAEEYGHGKRPHPLPITVTYISEGIKRLRAVFAAGENATKVTNLWRGMKNIRMAEEFMADLRGGTEVAPMSTTSDLRVAAQYGVSDNSLLFKIKVSNFLQYGANLQWLSAFPDEAEVCYPPLTYLQPTGKTQVVSVVGKRFM
ncbi:MAG: hypothetical protein SGPRY_003439, partial [Prymnesium sp.]